MAFPRSPFAQSAKCVVGRCMAMAELARAMASLLKESGKTTSSPRKESGGRTNVLYIMLDQLAFF